MKKIALMANDVPGLNVCKYLVDRGEKIERLYVHSYENAKFVNEIIAASNCLPENVFDATLLNDADHVHGLNEAGIEWIVTVYWAYLLSGKVIRAAKEGTVNFHPALLPINRGWYPHVHSIIDGTPCGVTIHAIDENADTGPIWAQKEIPLLPEDTAATIYARLQEEIVVLFKEKWADISNGRIIPLPQDESKAVYHKKAEIAGLDELDLDAQMCVGDLLNLLRARSFGDRGFAYFYNGGEKVYVNIRLSKKSDFSGK